MIDILSQILCWIKQIGALVLNAFIDGFNLLVSGLAGFVQGIIDLDPISFPDIPDWPEPMETAYGWISWVLPVGTLINILAFIVVAWVTWQIVAIALRWMKATAE